MGIVTDRPFPLSQSITGGCGARLIIERGERSIPQLISSSSIRHAATSATRVPTLAPHPLNAHCIHLSPSLNTEQSGEDLTEPTSFFFTHKNTHTHTHSPSPPQKQSVNLREKKRNFRESSKENNTSRRNKQNRRAHMVIKWPSKWETWGKIPEWV